jgi:hypothetical protein
MNRHYIIALYQHITSIKIGIQIMKELQHEHERNSRDRHSAISKEEEEEEEEN